MIDLDMNVPVQKTINSLAVVEKPNRKLEVHLDSSP